VIYNGNPIKEINLTADFKPSVNPRRPFLFSIGEFTERKNFKSLVKMLTLLPDYDLIIAGKNSTSNAEEIRELVKKNNLQNRVFMPGKISEEEKQYYYQNCAAFVFPSLREGFGLPIIEAMRFAKPVFTSNNTSLPEIGGDLVFLWDNYDREEMVEIFHEGMRTFKMKQDWFEEKMVKRAKSFDWNTAADQYLNVYQSLLK
jgi:glycosyltransferase involved in cell wall biosynthesis